MREKLNENPMAQVALIGVLLVVAAVFLLGKGGGAEEEEEEGGSAAADAAVSAVASELETRQPLRLPPPGSGVGAPPAPPRAVIDAFDAGETVAILFVRNGGIDDRLVREAVSRLDAIDDVATFVVPDRRLARYVSIAQGVDLSRIPALVVIRPKHLNSGYDPASVHYGFQSAQSIVQAVVDARYRGGTLPYHP